MCMHMCMCMCMCMLSCACSPKLLLPFHVGKEIEANQSRECVAVTHSEVLLLALLLPPKSAHPDDARRRGAAAHVRGPAT